MADGDGWFSSLWPQWLGGTAGQTTLSPTQTADISSMVNPGAIGTQASTVDPQFWSGQGFGGGTQAAQPASQKLADALQGLSKPDAQQHNPAPQQASLGLRAPQVSSQAYRGQNSLGEVLQMLMQRQNMYGPPNYSGGSSSGRGLLGT